MANPKNRDRNKKKYTEQRKSITERNRSMKQPRHEMRTARLVARTTSLIGKQVLFRTAGGIKPRVGTVVEVISKGHDRYPEGGTRNYLSIRDSAGMLHIKSRHRVKPIKEDNAV